ncbi:hypothetical protein D3C72_1548210 [compost metagenome]
MGNHAAEPDGSYQQHDANDRHFAHPSRTQEAHVNAHKQGNRHGGTDGEHAPRAFCQRFYYDQGQHRQDDDHDQEAAKQRDGAWDWPHFLFDDLAQ